MVFSTFSRRYGIPVTFEEHHAYSSDLHCYRKIHHVECVPLKLPLPAFQGVTKTTLSHEELQDKIMVFQSFRSPAVDPYQSLNEDESERMDFDYAQVQLVCAETGYRFRQMAGVQFFVEKDDVDYEFVAETYDPLEHRRFREVFV